MEKFIVKHIRVILILTSLALLGIVAFAIVNRKKKKAKLDELFRLIDENIGVNGPDFKSIMDKVKPDQRFSIDKLSNGKTRADNAAQIIYEAYFTIYPLIGYQRRLTDDNAAVKNVLKGRTKAEIKTIQIAFATKYGEELSDFLKKYNTAKELNEFYTIINNLK